MVYGDLCRIDKCEKFVTKPRGTLCEPHRYRWQKFKSFNEPIKTKLPEGIVKICGLHGQLTIDSIHTSERKGRNSPQIRCYECYLVTQRNSKKKSRIERQEENSIKRKAYYQRTIDTQHATNRRRRFGISQEDYQNMLDSQNHLCGICFLPETAKINGRIKKLCIDHCHESEISGVMRIRGLLCLRCNVAFGYFRESIEILQNAILYAKKYNQSTTE